MNTATHPTQFPTNRLPPWFRQELPSMEKIDGMKNTFRARRLHTVCETAHCPNMGQCWSRGVATFMILGDVCTRGCRFCAVPSGRPLGVDPQEPRHVAQTIQEMNLRYVVITSVARDDLPDEGCGHFARTVQEIRCSAPQVKIEILIPDFSAREEHLKVVVESGPEVISHNMETVRRLSSKVRPQADYTRSLGVLKTIKRLNPAVFVKSSFMVGLGETEQEIGELMQDLLEAGCQILTIGQYLAPSRKKRHLPVESFLSPEKFESYRRLGLDLGFRYVRSGPLVRSSYLAEEGYQELLKAHQS